MNDSNYPWAYIQGFVDFFGVRILCDERALIPRFESESLVRYALKQIEQAGTSKHHSLIWDVGAGTGVLGISLLKALDHKNTAPTSLIISDISQEAIDLAYKNIELHALSARSSHLVSSLLSRVPDGIQITDHLIILANLPYIRDDEKEIMSPDTAYEPSIALYGSDPDGLGLYRILIEQIKDIHRNYNNLTRIDIFFEYGHDQKTDFLASLDWPGTYTTFDDLSGTQRFAHLTLTSMTFKNLNLSHMWQNPQAKAAIIYHDVVKTIHEASPEITPTSVEHKGEQIIISCRNPVSITILKESQELILQNISELFKKYGDTKNAPKKIAFR
ncbi:MAG: methyltransferase [Candidatus Gracilibacteria bacterium]